MTVIITIFSGKANVGPAKFVTQATHGGTLSPAASLSEMQRNIVMLNAYPMLQTRLFVCRLLLRIDMTSDGNKS